MSVTAVWAVRQQVRDIQQHDAVDAETEHHGRHAGTRRRQSRAEEAEHAQHDCKRERRWQGAHANQPQAAEYDEQQREDRARAIQAC